MKKALDFLMSNRYITILVAVMFFSLKLVLDYNDIPEKYLPWFNAVTKVFLTIFIIAIVHLLSFFILAISTKNQSTPWWERKVENGGKPLNYYAYGLIVTLPIVMYGTLLYFVVFASWKNILIIGAIFIISRFVKKLQDNKRRQWQREL